MTSGEPTQKRHRPDYEWLRQMRNSKQGDPTTILQDHGAVTLATAEIACISPTSQAPPPPDLGLALGNKIDDNYYHCLMLIYISMGSHGWVEHP